MNKHFEDVTGYFEKMAAKYDYWKNKNWYYNKELKQIARRYTKGAKNVLDAGCGTGTILLSLNIEKGTGIDISSNMIAIARQKNIKAMKKKSFFISDIANFDTTEKFDVIIFMDVIEHILEPKPAIEALKRLVTKEGIIVVTMANPGWEPILMLGEKLGLKMPEGPHYRLPASQLIKLAEKSGLHLKKREWRLLFPKYIPFVSWSINYLGRLPLIKRFCVIEVFVFGRTATANKID